MLKTHADAIEEQNDHVERDAQRARHVLDKEATGEGGRGRDGSAEEGDA